MQCFSSFLMGIGSEEWCYSKLYRCQPTTLVIFPQYRIYDNSLNLEAELGGN